MSIQILTDLAQTVPQAAAVVPMASDDLLGWSNEKINAVGVLFRSGAVVLGIFFIIMTAIRTRGAMAAIVVAGLSAGLFIYLVWNVTDLKDRVDNEVNAAPTSAGLGIPGSANSDSSSGADSDPDIVGKVGQPSRGPAL